VPSTHVCSARSTARRQPSLTGAAAMFPGTPNQGPSRWDADGRDRMAGTLHPEPVELHTYLTYPGGVCVLATS